MRQRSGQFKTECSGTSASEFGARTRTRARTRMRARTRGARKEPATGQAQAPVKARRAISEDDFVRSGRQVDGAKRNIGRPNRRGNTIDSRRPARVERVGQHQDMPESRRRLRSRLARGGLARFGRCLGQWRQQPVAAWDPRSRAGRGALLQSSPGQRLLDAGHRRRSG